MGAIQPTPRSSALSADRAVAPVIPHQMQDVTQLMIGEESPQECRQLHRAFGQRVIGKHRGVEVAEEIARRGQRTEVFGERALGLTGPPPRR